MDFKDISYNFSVVKVISILILIPGHYSLGSIFWVPTAIGLFIVGFSSAFFSASKYTDNFSASTYWAQKIDRLGYKLLVINLFLLVLFFVENRSGIWTWQTLLIVCGFKGFFNWFKIPNNSPFGEGLWFFTLLLIFYITYPALKKLNKSRRRAYTALFFSLPLFILLQYTVPMGHTLWLTAFSFIFGVLYKSLNLKQHTYTAMTIALSAGILMLVFNFMLGLKAFNYMFIIIISIATVILLMGYRLPSLVFSNFTLLSGCILEIYFIHVYLFIKLPQFPWVINISLTTLVTIITALTLSKTAAVLKTSLRLQKSCA